MSAGARIAAFAGLFAPGDFTVQELPPRSDRATVDGYDVSLQAHGASALTFAVTRAGKPVTDIAFATAGATEPASQRLFVQFRHGDRVHTAACTR